MFFATVQEVRAQLEELSSFYNDLKKRLQDAETEISLTQIEKTVMAERIKASEQENRALRAEIVNLQKLFEEVYATRTDCIRKKSCYIL